TVRFRPQQFPRNPYDDKEFSCDLVIIDAQQLQYRFPAFYRQAGTFIDRGDHEIMHNLEAAYFEARFRPKTAGTFRAHLQARWGDNLALSIPLPSLLVSGTTQDPYVHVDEQDPRFFSIGKNNKNQKSKFFWPNGINIRSVTDLRGTKRTQSQPTPLRIVHAYKAYLDRLALAGGNCAEVWLSSWNLAIEWKDQWPGFHGVGAYHEANAERIDHILDYAWDKKIRIIFVVNNHGQASTGADAEWKDSPYNALNGGPLKRASDTFSNKQAQQLQQRHRRYLVARYADHPAILCWKLWTEMNLTRGSRDDLKTWHQAAFRSWHRLDTYYQHPCATHWSGDYNVPDRNLVRLHEMDIIAIDAYHRHGYLPQLLHDSSLHPNRGLAQFNKPLVVTEFGGNWDACPIPQLKAEHALGAWVALTSGHASAPHLWWFEWVDQHDYWLPFRSISRFIDGEDLRGENARSVSLDIRNTEDQNSRKVFWARAWARSGCILGYVLDAQWANDGHPQALHQQQQVLIASTAKAGPLTLEWWDPQTGNLIEKMSFQHSGGELRILIPDFRRHIAFKLKRTSNAQSQRADL
ncbi:MAG: hypothetical protein HRU15_04265, partial [Planctomycetes bacterium]|nr:hypothetical protein [Planctomycetota bacterium]